MSCDLKHVFCMAPRWKTTIISCLKAVLLLTMGNYFEHGIWDLGYEIRVMGVELCLII